MYINLRLFSAVIYQSFMIFPSLLSLLSDLSNTHTLHFCISAFLQIFHLKWRASANVSLCNVEVSRMCHKTFTRSPNCSLTLFFFFSSSIWSRSGKHSQLALINYAEPISKPGYSNPLYCLVCSHVKWTEQNLYKWIKMVVC